MGRLKIGNNKSGFTLDGKPFFYLGDTIWSAFTNVTLEEWEYYLHVRKTQGFNVLQINTMPQWDRCMSDVGVYPFATEDGMKFDFSAWNEEYYERARKMCAMAVKEGFQLALVVLWLNHVPDTWGSNMLDINVMPEAFVKEYAQKIVDEFDEFDPIYVISGDTDFETEAATGYYKTALEVICEKSPESLKTLHIRRGYDMIPEVLDEKIDFYMFQSGHNSKGQHMAYVLPENIRKKYPKKPMINSEPCYEQMGYSRQEYGRFGQREVRQAAWTSILSGASAGVTYGAHGIWNWQKMNCPKNPVIGEGFDEPLCWQDAIKFPGAWDYGFIKNVLRKYGSQELVPASEWIENTTETIRMAATEEGYLVYVPYNTKVCIGRELEGYTCRALDLAEKRVADIDMSIQDGRTVVAMHPFQQDVLLVIEKG
ncbi:MAG: DUF4038 domain-containing protein [Eubacteriales bacterium]|nr:DUF4038 domain-containing protein [Eubacteriales bacterium]